MRRPYDAIATRLEAGGSRRRRMNAVVDALWEELSALGVSWVGFYVDQGPGVSDERRLVLGPRRDRAACSPIGLHGACGGALRSRTILVVRDVRELGAAYIACDPHDRSEIVVPLLEDDGSCWGVLDLDSREAGAFDEHDAAGLAVVLRAAGFRPGPLDARDGHSRATEGIVWHEPGEGGAGELPGPARCSE
jgi:putative methionine-R-sulfoxide reductase with GAF domain